MKKAFVALVLSPFIFAGSAGNYYLGGHQSLPDSSLKTIIQQKADSFAYATLVEIDSLCRRPVIFVQYSDLDKRPDGRIFRWDTWVTVTGLDTIYSHTEIKRIR